MTASNQANSVLVTSYAKLKMHMLALMNKVSINGGYYMGNYKAMDIANYIISTSEGVTK